MQIDSYKSIQNIDHRLEMHIVCIPISVILIGAHTECKFRFEIFDAKSLHVQIRGGGAAIFCRAVGRSKNPEGVYEL